MFANNKTIKRIKRNQVEIFLTIDYEIISSYIIARDKIELKKYLKGANLNTLYNRSNPVDYSDFESPFDYIKNQDWYGKVKSISINRSTQGRLGNYIDLIFNIDNDKIGDQIEWFCFVVEVVE